MDEKTRSEMKAQLDEMTIGNARFRALVGMPPVPILGGLVPVPISVEPALMPYLQALRSHAEDFDKLVILLKRLVEKM